MRSLINEFKRKLGFQPLNTKMRKIQLILFKWRRIFKTQWLNYVRLDLKLFIKENQDQFFNASNKWSKSKNILHQINSTKLILISIFLTNRAKLKETISAESAKFHFTNKSANSNWDLLSYVRAKTSPCKTTLW